MLREERSNDVRRRDDGKACRLKVKEQHLKQRMMESKRERERGREKRLRETERERQRRVEKRQEGKEE